jgi:hypothetical protein
MAADCISGRKQPLAGPPAGANALGAPEAAPPGAEGNRPATLRPLPPKALEEAFRNSTRKDGPSLFRAIRAARARGENPDPEVVRLHYAMIAGGPDARSMTLTTETIALVRALAEAATDERDELLGLAKAFIAGCAVDPDSLTGRRRAVAIAFYGEIEGINEDAPPMSAYAIAKVHARHRQVAEGIAQRAGRGQGERKMMALRIFELVDDFLIVVMLAAKVAGLELKFSGDPDSVKSALATLCETSIGNAERAFLCLAKKTDVDSAVIEPVKLALSDLHGRKLADRMRNVIKTFGQIDPHASL